MCSLAALSCFDLSGDYINDNGKSTQITLGPSVLIIVEGIKPEMKDVSNSAKPVGDRVLVEPIGEKVVKTSSIIVLHTAKAKPTEEIVRAIGPGKLDEDGKRLPMEVQEGDRIFDP